MDIRGLLLEALTMIKWSGVTMVCKILEASKDSKVFGKDNP